MAPPREHRRSFHKRRYRFWGEFLFDFGRLFKRGARVGDVLAGRGISTDFRLRLMLTASRVNGCRHCTYHHARHALRIGVDNDEVEALCRGMIGDCPERELPALIYAQHWTAADGCPDPGMRRRFRAAYPRATADAVELTLRMIRLGNLFGNSFDYLLFRLSGGRWGLGDRSFR